MSITINSNMAASYSALSMKRSNNLLTKSLQRLSSGKRIVSPSDDAGGLAVGMKLESSLKRSAASRLNTQNGVSFLQMQDGVLKVAGEILDRMAELKSFWNDISEHVHFERFGIVVIRHVLNLKQQIVGLICCSNVDVKVSPRSWLTVATVQRSYMQLICEFRCLLRERQRGT